MSNIYFRHACLTKAALIASMLFIASWFALASRTVVNLDEFVDPFAVPYGNSLFVNPNLPGYLDYEGSTTERARKLIIP